MPVKSTWPWERFWVAQGLSHPGNLDLETLLDDQEQIGQIESSVPSQTHLSSAGGVGRESDIKSEAAVPVTSLLAPPLRKKSRSRVLSCFGAGRLAQ